MPNEDSKIVWKQVIITAFLSLIVYIIFYHYTSKSPELIYEVFPPAYFTKQKIQISIYNARIENIGDKEAEDVQVYFELPQECNIQDIKVEPKLKSIPYSLSPSSRPNLKEIHFPLLNPGDNCRVSILVGQGNAATLKLEVRAKGLTGHAGRSDKSNTIFSFFPMASGILGLLLAIIVLVLDNFSSLKRMAHIFDSQKRIFDKGVQFVRTQGTLGNKYQLKGILLNNSFRLFFNPKVPGLDRTKILRFGKEGDILEGKNRNESTWRIKEDFLEFLNDQGQVYSRFYYSPSDSRFYHTNDPDTLSIRDQYILIEK